MPLLQFCCPYCQGLFQVEDRWVGQAVACPTCSGLVTVPAVEAAPEEQEVEFVGSSPALEGVDEQRFSAPPSFEPFSVGDEPPAADDLLPPSPVPEEPQFAIGAPPPAEPQDAATVSEPAVEDLTVRTTLEDAVLPPKMPEQIPSSPQDVNQPLPAGWTASTAAPLPDVLPPEPPSGAKSDLNIQETVPHRKVRVGGRTRTIRLLSPREKQRRRGRRSIVVLIFSLTVLILTLILLGRR